MSFTSFQEFLAMGQHGFYVWLCYGAALIIVAYNVVSVRVRRRRFFREAWDRQRRELPSRRQPAGPASAATGEPNR